MMQPRRYFLFVPEKYLKALNTSRSAKNALKEKKNLVGITIEINKNE